MTTPPAAPTTTTTTTPPLLPPASPLTETMPLPTEEDVSQRLAMINKLKHFLVTAPNDWNSVLMHDPPIKRYSLPTGEPISCVKWSDGYFISGTDIVRSLVFRFHAFGRPVQNLKKFEEGIFSDLRNLKPGTDATLEEPKSAFLDLLYKHNCIRTQKKQKVFSWFAVPHDRLFLDALERDLKRERLGVEPTSLAVANPAVSISLDTTQAMFDEFRKNMLDELEFDACLTKVQQQQQHPSLGSPSSSPRPVSCTPSTSATSRHDNPAIRKASSVFGHFDLFEGSPTYKQRRRRTVSSGVANNDNNNNNNSSRYGSHQHRAGSGSSDDDTSRFYTCPLSSCGKLFKRLEHLKRHLRTHTMERPYLCTLCGKRFSRSDNLAQHKKTHERRHHRSEPSVPAAVEPRVNTHNNHTRPTPLDYWPSTASCYSSPSASSSTSTTINDGSKMDWECKWFDMSHMNYMSYNAAAAATAAAAAAQHQYQQATAAAAASAMHDEVYHTPSVYEQTPSPFYSPDTMRPVDVLMHF